MRTVAATLMSAVAGRRRTSTSASYPLVVASVEVVVATVAEDSPLGARDARFADVGGRCRAL